MQEVTKGTKGFVLSGRANAPYIARVIVKQVRENGARFAFEGLESSRNASEFFLTLEDAAQELEKNLRERIAELRNALIVLNEDLENYLENGEVKISG